MWICIRSTRPPYQAAARASWAAPSSADGVQILSAMTTRSRWPSSAPASSRSASPYIGEVSNSPMPAAIAAPMSSRCRPAAAAASSRRQVPSPTAGTLTRPRPRVRFSMSVTSLGSVPQSLMPVYDPGPTGLERRVTDEQVLLTPASELPGRLARPAEPLAPRPCRPYLAAALTGHVRAPGRAATGLAAQMVVS